MLILSRKCTERIMLGDGIEVKVLEIRGNTVKLGFTAPGELKIRRSELAAKPKTQGE